MLNQHRRCFCAFGRGSRRHADNPTKNIDNRGHSQPARTVTESAETAKVETKKEAVNLAMRDYVERFRRVEALARSRDHAKNWDYEGWLAARADEKALGS